MNSESDFVLRVKDYAFRRIREKDLPLLLAWRNSPEIHSKMFTDHKITPEEHLNWFERIRLDSVPKKLVFTFKSKPVGYYAYNDFDEENHTCTLGDYIGEPATCPIDAGVFMAFLGAEYCFQKL